jgi:hypothetical protein
MRLLVDELGSSDYLLHILNNLLRFVKYFHKKFSLGIYAPPTENPQCSEKGDFGSINIWILDFRLTPAIKSGASHVI